jgi:methylenetetrahydrofolate reductase (NADPH)
MIDTRCPKSMAFGPCGGVRHDHRCEVDDRPCPFMLGDATTVEPPQSRTALPLRLPNPLIVVDVRALSGWNGDARALWRHAGEALRGCVALLGEHVDNPPRHDDSGALDPVDVVELLSDSGVPVIITVTGRDRDLVAARQCFDAYRVAGAIAVHCVTGDHPAALGIDRPAWFGCESVTLLGQAHASGIAATVGESPASPGDRVGRLGLKQRAGAAACILNHHGSVDDMIRFVDACLASDVNLPLIAPVPMIGDLHSALALARFPGLRLPPDLLDRVIAAPDPATEARIAAIAMSAELSRSGRFAGVNLSGATGATDPWERLRITGDLAQRIREAWI